MDDVKEMKIRDAEIALNSENILIAKKNNGVHFVLVQRGAVIDFWPTSGKWKDRDGPSGANLPSLLRHIRQLAS